MIVLSSRFSDSDLENFYKWKWVNLVVRKNLTPEMATMWISRGYEGLFDLVPGHFGMTRMYRNPQSHVTYEFTEPQWTLFVLRWR